MRRHCLIAAVLIAALFASNASAKTEPVRLILDTDIGNDIDDALALAMIHALENRAEVKLLAVTITKDNKYAAPFVSLVNTFYGRAYIPIGVVQNGKTPEDSPMLRIPVERRGAKEALPNPEEAVSLLRKILNEQPDGSVTIAQIGFSTNLARLIKSEGGRDLVTRKVKTLYLMAGSFATQKPEYNVYIDVDSAKVLMAEWPTPMIFSPFEVGTVIAYPYRSIANDFSYVDNHPIAEAYRTYMKGPKDRPNWDSTAVLQAIRPDRGYFALSPPGSVEVDAKGVTTFTPDPAGRCRYMIVKADEVARIVELLCNLVSEPPQKLSNP